MMDTEILHFGYLGVEIIEFKNFGKWQFSNFFGGGRYFNLRNPKDFWNLIYQLHTQFPQLSNGQNAKFLCQSDAEFPGFLKNSLIFYHSSLLLGVIVKKLLDWLPRVW